MRQSPGGYWGCCGGYSSMIRLIGLQPLISLITLGFDQLHEGSHIDHITVETNFKLSLLLKAYCLYILLLFIKSSSNDTWRANKRGTVILAHLIPSQQETLRRAK